MVEEDLMIIGLETEEVSDGYINGDIADFSISKVKHEVHFIFSM
jgi:hypothetical protein